MIMEIKQRACSRLQNIGICRGNHSDFISISKGMEMPTVLPWVPITEHIFFPQLKLAVCRESKSSKDSECYIIEVAMKVSTSGYLE